MQKVLFICQANVGRSQMAEGFYNHFTNSDSAISGAVEDFAEKYNYHPTKKIVDVMEEKGINISQQKIKMTTPEMCEKVDKIVVLCNKDICPDFITKNKKTVFEEVSDPFEQTIEFTRAVRDKIEQIVRGLIEIQKIPA